MKPFSNMVDRFFPADVFSAEADVAMANEFASVFSKGVKLHGEAEGSIGSVDRPVFRQQFYPLIRFSKNPKNNEIVEELKVLRRTVYELQQEIRALNPTKSGGRP